MHVYTDGGWNCSECDQSVQSIAVLTGFDDETAHICESCLRQAISLIEESKSAQESA